jgi:2,4-diaminopentanoate dehydrogenase
MATDTIARVAIYGPGKMGLSITRMLNERGVPVVAGIARNGSKTIGQDLGTLAGLPCPLDVIVSDKAEEKLKETKPNIVVVTVSSYLDDVLYEIFKKSVEADSNVITIAEEMLFPFATSEGRSKLLDTLAKKHHVTVTGTGHQDAYWVNLVSTMMGSAHRIQKVKGCASWNVDDFGTALAEQQRVDTTEEDFKEWIKKPRKPTFGRISLCSLAATTGLHPTNVTTISEAVLAKEDTYCKAKQTTIKKGKLLGYTDTDTMNTEEHIDLVISSTGKVYKKGESDYNEWTATTESAGAAVLHLRNDKLRTEITTCATLINRIPDVLTAKPGLITIDQLPQLRYHAFP